MKQCFLLLLIILFTTYNLVNAEDSRIIVASAESYDFAPIADDDEETEKKFELLTELVAVNWDYLDAATIDNSPETYLENVAEYIYKEYNTSIEEKVKCLKARHVLELFDLTTVYEQHVAKAYRLDNLVVHLKDNLSYGLQQQYSGARKLVNVLALNEMQLATDLLVQSFAPINLYEIPGVLEKLSKKYNYHKQQEMEEQSIRQTIGTLKLINTILDPAFRLTISIEEALTINRKKLRKQLEEKVKANFEITQEPEDNKVLLPDETEITEKFSNSKLITESIQYNESQTESVLKQNYSENNSKTTSKLILNVDSTTKSNDLGKL